MCCFISLLQGNMESAFSIYKEALEMAAAEEKLHALPILYVHFSRLKYMVGSICSFALSIGILTILFNDVLLIIIMVKIQPIKFLKTLI